MQPWTTLIQYSLAKFVDLRQLLNNSNIIQSTVNEYWINVVRLWPISSNPITWNCITCFNFFSWLPCYSITPTSTHSPVLCKDLFFQDHSFITTIQTDDFFPLICPIWKVERGQVGANERFFFFFTRKRCSPEMVCVVCADHQENVARGVWHSVCVQTPTNQHNILTALVHGYGIQWSSKIQPPLITNIFLLTIVVNVSCFC